MIRISIPFGAMTADNSKLVSRKGAKARRLGVLNVFDDQKNSHVSFGLDIVRTLHLGAFA
jgi:hypothetical protein